jgi:ABC-type dipeptide/oligopeptide/nickel transport system ATPase component
LNRGKVLLHARNLSLSLIGDEGSIRVVDGVELKIHEGETVGLIGPTGTGKTVTARAIMRVLQPILFERPIWEIEGEVLYRGRDLMNLSEDELNELRGSEMSMIYQNPAGALNPMLVIGHQTGEPVEAHEDIEAQRLKEVVIDYLGKVELPDARRRFNFFKHQFSSGESQRIMIAMALICWPSLLIADEPTSELDVTVQRQVLELLKRMKEEFSLSTLLITHDLGVIAEMSDHVYVMYAGRIVEHGTRERL